MVRPQGLADGSRPDAGAPEQRIGTRIASRGAPAIDRYVAVP